MLSLLFLTLNYTQGEQGDQGPQGQKGLALEIGVDVEVDIVFKGAKGEKGDDGEVGFRGRNGNKGQTGTRVSNLKNIHFYANIYFISYKFRRT